MVSSYKLEPCGPPRLLEENNWTDENHFGKTWRVIGWTSGLKIRVDLENHWTDLNH